ncbi:efflux RND transporter periplasmic adaptor subunit [Euryhalocaulis caribicus]|uniref:efflux RND transporter periplasmic adaptor subunit n=1 Tax=Euryhalocaulis caribicus TaxID=1161401 RepID=UPI00039D5EE4|nr:efflux RND transporter periplasmic adaptor subunit [Euryhalocaulis caribicus]
MTRPLIAWIGLAAAILVAGCSGEAAQEPEIVKTAQIETVETASKGLTREFVGRVEARIAIDVTMRVGGRLQEFPVEEGDRVSKGDLIARLEVQDYNRAVREAQVRVEQTRTDLVRARELFEQNATPKAQLDSAQTAYDLAVVALDQARQNLEYARFTAPFDGLVTRKYVDNYTQVDAGTPIARLQDTGELRVAIQVPEDLIATVSADSVAMYATFPFAPDRQFPLEYRELIAEPDQASLTYKVMMALPEGVPASILPGMTADVVANVAMKGPVSGAVRVPVAALDDTPEGDFVVWTYDAASGAVAPRPVKPSRLDNGGVLVTEGLQAGEQIVTAGVAGLQEGMRVRPLGDELD